MKKYVVIYLSGLMTMLGVTGCTENNTYNNDCCKDCSSDTVHYVVVKSGQRYMVPANAINLGDGAVNNGSIVIVNDNSVHYNNVMSVKQNNKPKQPAQEQSGPKQPAQEQSVPKQPAQEQSDSVQCVEQAATTTTTTTTIRRVYSRTRLIIECNKRVR